uniref:BAR domain-containing protein n=1 Tax=Macrostomum lignano TaxID=282301 RepID=A0A1I8J352_9PLAT
LTEEKLGQAERTAFPPDGLSGFLKSTEAVLQPNPAHRVEDLMCEKFEREKRDRLSPLEDLGCMMATAGAELGSTTDYGGALARVGQVEKELAELERDFIKTSTLSFLRPLREFLETDVKAAAKEKRELDNARLVSESDYAKEQQQYERQLEVTRLLLEGIKGAHANHLRALKDFTEAQMQYHAESFHKMQELRRELNSS